MFNLERLFPDIVFSSNSLISYLIKSSNKWCRHIVGCQVEKNSAYLRHVLGLFGLKFFWTNRGSESRRWRHVVVAFSKIPGWWSEESISFWGSGMILWSCFSFLFVHVFADAGAMTSPNAHGGPAGFQRPAPQGIAIKTIGVLEANWSSTEWSILLEGYACFFLLKVIHTCISSYSSLWLWS